MSSSEACILLGSTKEDEHAPRSLSSSSSEEDLPQTEVVALEQILHNFPDFKNLDSVLEDSKESEASMSQFNASLAISQKENNLDTRGDLIG